MLLNLLFYYFEWIDFKIFGFVGCVYLERKSCIFGEVCLGFYSNDIFLGYMNLKSDIKELFLLKYFVLYNIRLNDFVKYVFGFFSICYSRNMVLNFYLEYVYSIYGRDNS